MFNINIIGAGVCGLSTAVCLAEQFPNSKITVTSSDWHPYTTSDHGFGIVILRDTGITDNKNALKNVLATMDYCKKFDQQEAVAAGIKLVEALYLFNDSTEKGKQMAFLARSTGVGVREMNESEKKQLPFSLDNPNVGLLFEGEKWKSESLKLEIGHCYVIDTGRYLPWLKQKLELMKHSDGKRRITFVKRKLSSLTDVGPCNLIVNCSGLGAKDLVNDDFVVPIRGQYLSLNAPEVKRMLILNHTFLVPRYSDVAAGSVYQIGRSNQQVDPDDTEDILQRIEVGFPSVRKAEVRRVDVGIRPGRIGGPRVELEIKKCGCCNKSTPVIHNYGHGPRGIAQHWGCAMTVAHLSSTVLKSSNL